MFSDVIWSSVISTHFLHPYLSVSCRSSCALCIWASKFDVAVCLSLFLIVLFFKMCSWDRCGQFGIVHALHFYITRCSIKERDLVLFWRLCWYILLTWLTRQQQPFASNAYVCCAIITHCTLYSALIIVGFWTHHWHGWQCTYLSHRNLGTAHSCPW